MAQSVLAQQLLNVQLLHGQVPYKKPKGRPSLLYDFHKAADIDGQTVYEIGQQGFQELCRLNSRFSTLSQALFSNAAASVVRDQLNQEELEKLNEAIHEFCVLLVPHFLSSACFQALEYMVRQFKVHEHNIDSLMLAALPYHTTNEFVRLVQILAIDSRRGLWMWLDPIKKSGAAVPRVTLVERALNDTALLHFICKGAQKLGAKGPAASSTYLGFYSVTLCEAVQTAKVIDTSFLSQLLPYITSGLESSASTDYRAATLMIVSALASKAHLEKTFIRGVVNSTLRNMDPGKGQSHVTLLWLSHLAITQPIFTTISEKALKALLAAPGLGDQLLELSSGQFRLTPFLRVLVSSLTKAMGSSGPGQYEAPLSSLISQGVFAPVSDLLATQLLEMGASAQQHVDGTDLVSAVQRLLRTLDLHHPAQVDAAVNAMLDSVSKPAGMSVTSDAEKSEKGDDNEKSEEEEEEDEEAQAANAARSEAVLKLLSSTFEGSARAPCGDTHMTLAAAAAAPSAGVRKAALKQMDTALSSPDVSPGTQAQLHSSILSTLQAADEWDVLSTALGLSCLPSISPSALLPALQPVLRRAAGLLFSQHRPADVELKPVRSAAAKAVRLLATLAAQHAAPKGDASSGGPSIQQSLTGGAVRDQAVLLLIQFLMPARQTTKASQTAVQVAAEVDHPLLKPLTAALGPLAPALHGEQEGGAQQAEGAADVSGGGKKKKKGSKEGNSKAASEEGKQPLSKAEVRARQEAAMAAMSRACIETLAKEVAKSPAKMGEEVLRLCAVARTLASEQASLHPPQPQGSLGLLRARHVLLLAVHTALTRAASRAASSAGGKSSSGAAAGASNTNSAASAASSLSHTLLQLCVAELQFSAQQASSAEGPNRAASALPDLGNWEEAAAHLLGPDATPTPEHSRAIAANHLSTHASMLCAALLAALKAMSTLAADPPAGASADGSTGKVTLVQPPAMFATVARLDPVPAFDPHLSLLLTKGLPDVRQRSAFLASVYATEAGDASSGALGASDPTPMEQAAALRLQVLECQAAAGPQPHVGTPVKGSSKAATAGPTVAEQVAAVQANVPHMLTAASSPLPPVRSAAVEALSAAAQLLAAHAAGQPARSALAALLRGLLDHAALIRSDPEAVTLLLQNTFFPSAATTSAASTAGDAAQAEVQQKGKQAAVAPTPTPTKQRRSTRSAAAGTTEAVQPESVTGGTVSKAAGVQVSVSGSDLQAAYSHLASALSTLQPGVDHHMRTALTLLSLLTPPPSSHTLSDESATAAVPAAQLLSALTLPATSLLKSLLVTHAPTPLTLVEQDVGALLMESLFDPAVILTPPAPLAPLLQAALACNASCPGAPSAASSDWFPSTTPLRLVALERLAQVPSVTSASSVSLTLSPSLFHALALGTYADSDPGCRTAARTALEGLNVSAAVAAPLLRAAIPVPVESEQPPAAAATPPAAKKSKKSKKGGEGGGSAAMEVDGQAAHGVAKGGKQKLAPPPGTLELAILVLEVLQWKQVQGEAEVIRASQELLSGLAPILSPLTQRFAAEAHSSDDAYANNPVDGGSHAQQSGTEEEGDAGAFGSQSALTGYAAQLILSALELIARRASAAGGSTAAGPESAPQQAAGSSGKSSKGGKKGKSEAAGGASTEGEGAGVLSAFDLTLVVSVANQAPDAAVRNAALSLMAVLAKAVPEQALQHVLQVLSLVNASTMTSEDDYSHEVAITALASVVPAWLASPNPSHDLPTLWRTLITALPSLPSYRRLSLLSALLRATPEEDSLPVALLLLLTAAVEAETSSADPAAQPAANAADASAASGGSAQQATPQSEWMVTLAEQLAAQVSGPPRLRCLAALLAASVEASEGRAYAPVPRLTVTFVAEQLKARSLVSAHAAAGSADAELQQGCESIMSQALQLVQVLVAQQEVLTSGTSTAPGTTSGTGNTSGGTGTAKGRGKPGATAGSGAAAAAAAAALAAEVAGLTPGELKRRSRAIRTCITGLYSLFEALQGVMAGATYLKSLLRLASNASDKVRRRALRLFADKAAGLAVELETISHHPELNSKQKQAAGDALLDAALQACGLISDPSFSKSSALTRQAILIAYVHVASGCGTLRPQNVLQAFPSVLQSTSDTNAAVRGSALACIAAVARVTGNQLVPLLPDTAQAVLSSIEGCASRLTARGTTAADQGSTKKSSKKSSTKAGRDDEDDEEKNQTPEQTNAVELAAGLAALRSLVDHLGPFLSPYISHILQILLHPAILACTAENCSTLAADIRRLLPQKVPARVLLNPLFDVLAHVMDQGIVSTAGLLSMVAEVATGMEAAVAAAHHEQIFGFLLRALDVRQSAPAALKGHEHEAERHAVATLVALTLKLSEAKFKPMFLRLLEWANNPLPGTSAAPIGRVITLFAAASALSEKLRSVFVPYFKYLLDLAVKHLGGASATAVGQRKSKKAKKGGEEADASSGGVSEVDAWVLRGRVVRALHRCFLYDTVNFIDQDKVDRLLPPLVAQLSVAPPSAESAAAVTAQCGDAELDSVVTFGPRTPRDTYGTAVVAALVQLAITANSDVHWKPLNRQVLMTTRTGNTRTRCLALEVVAHLVDRLREEYMVLLPETIPFLSELLEDTEISVEARAQDVLKAMEEISGEKLDQYLKT